jgi:hypothetical protein
MNLASNLISKNYSNNNMAIVLIDNEKMNIPNFMVENIFENIDTKSIYSALKLIGKFLQKNILLPNNLNYPTSRKNLESFYK